MTHAYDEICLPRASDTLGRMLDYAAYSLHHEIPAMMELFIASGEASCFERGDIRTIAGMSGIELAYEVLERSGITYDRTQPRYTKSLSAEYWCGYALAQIQWKSCAPFSRIIQKFSVQDFISEYAKDRFTFLDSLPLDISDSERSQLTREFGLTESEAAVSRFIRAAAGDSSGIYGRTLKDLRIRRGLSQSGLAKAAGIPVRTIQQYEQGQKDLSRAGAAYLISLARVLNCEPSHLIRDF